MPDADHGGPPHDAVLPVQVRHRTVYRYAKPVSLQPHVMMLYPRESRGLRLLSHRLEVSPHAAVTWSRDVADNHVATASFRTMAEELVIDSRLSLELPVNLRLPALSPHAVSFPFTHTGDDWVDLGACAQPQYADAVGKLNEWAKAFVRGESTDTLALLRDMNAGISAWVFYQSRDDEGTQGPLETLARGWGSCRDLAVLFAEAVRVLGFGARIVSGYIYLEESPPGLGATHAWVEVFLPGAGWIAFDPTHNTVGGANLIPIAVGRHIDQVMPVTGSFIGLTDAYCGMSVEVFVTA